MDSLLFGLADGTNMRVVVPTELEFESGLASPMPLDRPVVNITGDPNGKISYTDALDKYAEENNLNGHSVYEVYEEVFNVINNKTTSSEALKDLEQFPTIQFREGEFDGVIASLESYCLSNSSSTKYSLDWDAIMKEAKNSNVPTLLDDGAYELPVFKFYLTESNSDTVITYKTPDGVKAPDPRTVSGNKSEKDVVIASPTNVPGYVPDKKSITVSFSKPGETKVTVTYVKPGATTGTSTATDQSSLMANDKATITAGQPIDAATFAAEATDSNGQSIPVTVDLSHVNAKEPGTYSVLLTAANGKTQTVTLVVKAAAIATPKVTKNRVLYGLKTLYLYQKPTFNKHNRIVKYAKAKRIARPMFVVIGSQYSKTGLLRYKVRDVNQKSATYRKVGYITAKSSFVAPVYYSKAVSHIKVIGLHGINSYKQLDLAGKLVHVKKGQMLKVTGLKHYHQTTRFTLSNGRYVTANKELVAAGH